MQNSFFVHKNIFLINLLFALAATTEQIIPC